MAKRWVRLWFGIYVESDPIYTLYVAMTRATQELVMTHGETSVLGEKMGKAMGVLEAM